MIRPSLSNRALDAPFGMYLLVFATGAGMYFDFTVIGRVPASEFLAFASLPWLLRGRLSKMVCPAMTYIFVLLLVWMFGILLSDMMNTFYFERFIRAIAKPAFVFMWLLFFVSILLRDAKLLYAFSAGLLLASLQNYFMPRSFNEGYLIAGGYEAVAFGVVPIVFAASVFGALVLYRIYPFFSSVPFFLSSLILVLLGAPRNNMALMFLNGVIVLYLWKVHYYRKGANSVTAVKLVVFSIAMLAVCIGLYYFYAYAAMEGFLGELQRNKFEAQRNTIFGINPLGLILGGRTYVFAAILGIIDKPFIGHGSWTGWLMADYYIEALAMVGTDTRLYDRVLSEGAGKAGHSILFQSWLENGVLSALALFLLSFLMMKVFLRTITRDNLYAPLIIFISTAYMWDFLFSPFDVSARVAMGLLLAFGVICTVERAKRLVRVGR